MISSIATHILALHAWAALLVIFVLPALESSAFVGFVFPGETVLILGGVLAFEGRLSLPAAIAVGVTGAAVGDSIGYLVGRRYGRQILHGTLGRLVKREHVDRAQDYLASHGASAVFFGRFTAALRVLIPGFSGMARMPYGKFAVYNVAGAAVWGTMSVLLGYLGGAGWRRLAHVATRVGFAALGVLVLVLVGSFVARRARGAWARGAGGAAHPARIVAWAARRFPRATAWFVARLDPRSATGLGLSVAVVVAVGATWTFVGLTQDVHAAEEFALFDPHVEAWFLAHRGAGLTTAARAVAWLGTDAVTAGVLAVAAGVVLAVRRSWSSVLGLLIVSLSALVAGEVTQQVLRRPPPPAADRLAADTVWSYPSQPVVRAAIVYGLLALLLARGRSGRGKTVATGVPALVVVLVGLSQLYLGTSWLTDVLAGLTLSVAILGVAQIVRVMLLPAGPDAQALARVHPPGAGPG